MLKRHLAGPVAGALVAAALATAPVAPANAQRAAGTDSLASVLGADGVKFDSNWKDFDIVEAAVYAVAAAKPDSPVLVLADGTKRLTAFVPTDKAFRNLVKDLTGKSYSSDEEGRSPSSLGLVRRRRRSSRPALPRRPGQDLTRSKVVAAAKEKQKITMANGATHPGEAPEGQGRPGRQGQERP